MYSENQQVYEELNGFDRITVPVYNTWPMFDLYTLNYEWYYFQRKDPLRQILTLTFAFVNSEKIMERDHPKEV